MSHYQRVARLLVWGVLVTLAVVVWDRRSEREWERSNREISAPNAAWHERWEIMPDGSTRDRLEPFTQPTTTTTADW